MNYKFGGPQEFEPRTNGFTVHSLTNSGHANTFLIESNNSGFWPRVKLENNKVEVTII